MRSRLRQVALITDDLEREVSALRSGLDLRVGHVDDTMATWGLQHAVMPVGEEFLEVVAPSAVDSSARRYLDRSGPGGYLGVIQVDDLTAVEARLEDLAIRVAARFEEPSWRSVQLHPADLHGLFLTVDEADDFDLFPANGPLDPLEFRSSSTAGLTGMVVAAADPDPLLRLLSRLLDVAPKGSRLHLDHGTIQVVPGEGAARVVAVELAPLSGADPSWGDYCGISIRSST